MLQDKFHLTAEYAPAGDQPDAIENIISHFEAGARAQTLLGATGTGKTFTMANIIQHIQKPTLVISHNKTLAAQLATEFKYFFPKNAVHYFISYFDYYQPESYLPQQDIYIEKEATINQEIEMYRLATMASLLSRPDVIVVASASALYGLGRKESFNAMTLRLQVGDICDFQELKKKLIQMQYHPVKSKIEAGMFAFTGEQLDIYSSTEKILYRIHFNEDIVECIEKRDTLSFAQLGQAHSVVIWPATQFLQNNDNLEDILTRITKEMTARKEEFEKKGKLLEANRIEKKVAYDVRMIRETGFVNGIENYSPYFDERRPGETPNTLFNYFPDDFLFIVDESHMTIPQLQAMPAGDRARKVNLINHGFRLPSAIDHRPLKFEELRNTVGWQHMKTKETMGEKAEVDSCADIQRGEAIAIHTDHNENVLPEISQKKVKTLFVSATPAPYEKEISDNLVEQIIRPTGLLDPITYVYPKSGNYEALINSVDTLTKKKSFLKSIFTSKPQ